MPKFKPGNKEGKGGARAGAGRKPNWLKALATELLEKHKLIEYVAEVASGARVESRVVTSIDGKRAEILCSADTPSRLKAVEFLTDRAEGKPRQSIEHEGGARIDLVSLIRQAEDEGGMERTV